jgi:hypothetical protein
MDILPTEIIKHIFFCIGEYSSLGELASYKKICKRIWHIIKLGIHIKTLKLEIMDKIYLYKMPFEHIDTLIVYHKCTTTYCIYSDISVIQEMTSRCGGSAYNKVSQIIFDKTLKINAINLKRGMPSFKGSIFVDNVIINVHDSLDIANRYNITKKISLIAPVIIPIIPPPNLAKYLASIEYITFDTMSLFAVFADHWNTDTIFNNIKRIKIGSNLQTDSHRFVIYNVINAIWQITEHFPYVEDIKIYHHSLCIIDIKKSIQQNALKSLYIWHKTTINIEPLSTLTGIDKQIIKIDSPY